jgi:hypothetical protein
MLADVLSDLVDQLTRCGCLPLHRVHIEGAKKATKRWHKICGGSHCRPPKRLTWCGRIEVSHPDIIGIKTWAQVIDPSHGWVFITSATLLWLISRHLPDSLPETLPDKHQ